MVIKKFINIIGIFLNVFLDRKILIFIFFSQILECDMKFGLYLPDKGSTEVLSVLFFLTGNF